MVTVIPCVRLFLSVRPSVWIDVFLFFRNIHKVLSFLCSSEKIVCTCRIKASRVHKGKDLRS